MVGHSRNDTSVADPHRRRGMSARTLRTSAKQPQGVTVDRLRPPARWKGITKEKTPVACRACRGRSRGARRCFKRSSGFARHAAKKNVPRFPLEKIPKETGERSFLGGMVSEPEFRRRAPRAPPGSFKGFMRTMPPGRWGTAMEVSFLLGPGEGDRLRWWGTSPCTFKQKRCHNR